MQEARKWAGGRDKNESLDYSERSDGVRGASDADSGAESINMQEKSLVDLEEGIDSDDSEEVQKLAAMLFLLTNFVGRVHLQGSKFIVSMQLY